MGLLKENSESPICQHSGFTCFAELKRQEDHVTCRILIKNYMNSAQCAYMISTL